MKDLTFFPDPNLDRVVGLVMELAAQLHVERQRRAALEELLDRAGIVPRTDLDRLAGDAPFLEHTRPDLERAVAALLRVVTEEGHPHHPLRDDAATGA